VKLLGGGNGNGGVATATLSASPHERFGSALARIASATSALRTRGEDADRAQRNFSNGEWDLRVARAVERLEAVADELEKALA
jgi:hypothetical protein